MVTSGSFLLGLLEALLAVLGFTVCKRQESVRLGGGVRAGLLAHGGSLRKRTERGDGYTLTAGQLHEIKWK